MLNITLTSIKLKLINNDGGSIQFIRNGYNKGIVNPDSKKNLNKYYSVKEIPGTQDSDDKKEFDDEKYSSNEKQASEWKTKHK